MKRFLAILAAVLLAAPAFAGTPMLTSSGTATTATSSCPTTSIGTCDSGWFRVAGAKSVVIDVKNTTGTATVVLDWRIDSTRSSSVLKTWTDPSSTEVPVALDPPSGEVRIRVTAISGGGTIKASLEAMTPSGGKLW